MTMASAARMQPIRLASRSRYQTHPLPITDPNFLDDDFPVPLRQLIEEPRTLEATGIPQPFLTSLALKILYFGGTMKGWQIAQAMRLHFSGVVEPLLQELKAHHLVQVLGGNHLNRASYQYTITEDGSQRARELLERNRYVGPCPVNLEHYIQVVKLLAQNRPAVKELDVQEASACK